MTAAIPTGPFDRVPSELGQQVTRRAAPPAGEGDAAAVTQRWLRGLLAGAGVEVGAYDARVVAALSRDLDWPTLQAIGGWVARARGAESLRAITCPRCWRTSWNPNDVREGYCGFCHDWTSRSYSWLAEQDRLSETGAAT